ncbi:MAG: cell surface protein [Cardiobacteriaceae bacterium]|nr:cell surface protein [Cardiobacteriaceae bacterium]
MKKIMIAALMAAGMPAAFAGACDDYFAYMEETLKKDGAYTEEAMKVVKDQIAAIPDDQKEAVCKAGMESMKEDAAEDGEEKSEG